MLTKQPVEILIKENGDRHYLIDLKLGRVATRHAALYFGGDKAWHMTIWDMTKTGTPQISEHLSSAEELDWNWPFDNLIESL